jgi:hypothetical protein
MNPHLPPVVNPLKREPLRQPVDSARQQDGQAFRKLKTDRNPSTLTRSVILEPGSGLAARHKAHSHRQEKPGDKYFPQETCSFWMTR